MIVQTFVDSSLGKVSIDNIDKPQTPTFFDENSLKGVIMITKFKVGYFTIWSTHPHIELTELREATKSTSQRLVGALGHTNQSYS